MELTKYMGYLGQKLKECVTLRPGSDAVPHMSRIIFEFSEALEPRLAHSCRSLSRFL